MPLRKKERPIFLLALVLSLSCIAPCQQLSDLTGFWIGSITEGGKSRRIQVTFATDNSGKEACTYDSLDQQTMGIPCEGVELKGNTVSFRVPGLAGTYHGTLLNGGKKISGIWKQDTAVQLDLEREPAALPMPPRPLPKYDPAIAPVSPSRIQPLITKELASELKSGVLAPGTGIGVTVGLVADGHQQIFTFGAVKTDSIFEIGSITKTFTALALAQMVEQQLVRLDEPVRDLLPTGTVKKPDGAEITLLDLALHRSGLPLQPDNFKPADSTNPYADYGPHDLFAYLKTRGVGEPDHPSYLYSNVGYGLLGLALSNRAGVDYSSLVQREVTGPLGLKDTTIRLTPAQQQLFITGYESPGHPAHHWDLDALAGAGALRSTAGDILLYLEAMMRPESVAARTHPSAEGRTLPDAIKQALKLYDEPRPGMWLSLAWGYKAKAGVYFHDGGTGGFTSCALFNPKQGYGLVVLINVEATYGEFADNLCWHVSQRLDGTPALSLVQ